MSRALADLVNFLAMFLPMRVIVGGGLVLLVLAAPWWVESLRDRQIRGTVRRMVRAETEQRSALFDQVLSMADGKPARLRTLVEAATKYDQRDLRERGLGLLEQRGAVEVARRLREAAAPRAPAFRDPLEALVRVEALRAEGRTVAADEALAAARKAFPADPELAVLGSGLAGDRPTAGG